jgi:putative MATE family efflux protein
VRRHVWRLGWPQVIEQIIGVADDISDLFWAGRLPEGFRGVAGIGVGQTIIQMTSSLRNGLDHSVRAMIARAIGSGDIRLANHIALQSFTLNAIYAMIMGLIGILFTDVILNVIGVSPELHAMTSAYLQLQLIGRGALAFRTATATTLQASGDVITPLRAASVTRAVHMVLTPFLMFGWWGFPQMGLPGAALAGMIAHGCGGAMNSYTLFFGNTRLRLTFRGYRPDFPLMLRILKIAAPASLSATERSVAQVVLLRLVTPLGDIATAAYALTRRMENVSQLGSNGMGYASGVMVGQNLGAKQPERAKEAIRWGVAYIMLIQAIVGTLLVIFAPQAIGFFTGEPEVVELGSAWLRLQVAAYTLLAVSTVFQQSYNTAGDTLAPLVVMFTCMWAVEIPLAWFIVHNTGIGPVGMAIASAIGMAARIALYVPYYYWGRWLRINVIN